MTYDKKKYFKIVDDGKLSTSELIMECKKNFPVYSYWNEKELDRNFPAPKKKTVRYFKKVVEADEELKNMSVEDLEKKRIIGISLRERIIMELQYYSETGNHLDIDNWTLCSGSRSSGGNVPSAYWSGGFSVDRRFCGNHFSDLRAREAVSLKPNRV